MTELYIKLAIAAALFLVGLGIGVKWEQGVQARAELAAEQARESDAVLQRKFSDQVAGQHAAEIATITNKLGAAHEKIAQLSGRQCLDAGTVGVLNAIGGDPVPTAAVNPDSAPAAAATDQDVGEAIATCRAQYATVSDQLNKILDIEAQRQNGRLGGL